MNFKHHGILFLLTTSFWATGCAKDASKGAELDNKKSASEGVASAPKVKPTPQASAASMDKNALVAVKFHSDSCGSCKTIAPTIEAMKGKFKDIEFVRFDFSSEKSTAAAEKSATDMGITNIYQENRGKTGFVMVIDTEAKKVVAKLGKTDDETTWVETLTNASGA